MEATFEKLRTLQEILYAKFKLEKEINEIPKALVTKTEVLNRAKKAFIERNEQGEQAKAKVRRMVMELADATEKEQILRKDIQKEEKDLEELLITLEKQERQIALDEEELKEESDKIQAEGSSKRSRHVELLGEEKAITPG